MAGPARVAGNFASGGTMSAEERLNRVANAVLDASGYHLGRSKVRRLVRDFTARVERNGFEFFEFFANALLLDSAQRRRALTNPDVARAISYADPTGEAAVNNVLRGAR